MLKHASKREIRFYGLEQSFEPVMHLKKGHVKFANLPRIFIALFSGSLVFPLFYLRSFFFSFSRVCYGSLAFPLFYSRSLV
jgi:hypothetical protein